MKTVKITVSGKEPTKIVLARKDPEKESAKTKFVGFMKEKLAAKKPSIRKPL